MAFWYTDVALAQIQGNNFPGAPGQAQIVQPPTWQNNALLEGPPEIVATYIMTGSEAANDIINIAILNAGVIVDPNGKVATGLTAPTSGVLTLAIGDNDLGLTSQLPIPNAAAAVAAVGNPANTLQAPVWVSGTTYAPGNVVLDAASTPAYEAFTCLTATSGSTAPSSAANTVWMPNRQRYSNSIVANTAGLNVAFAGGTQNYGTPPSVVPQSVSPGVAISGYSTSQALFQQYQIQNDCWLQAKFLTLTATIAANTVLVFRVPLLTPN